ncbi:M1 family metallopeptidase [Actinophytocola oryzae]|uniref:Aminopeptidase N n=1 Tax=Actinophytocola oryzae TaxID=502181 RepID=A0A4R7UXA9_9PSEU|nr:M1 family metallopeptidase [Actinophytocola oryzae]TDV40727.1 peptidase M1-like protein [Actinophytocola oryzae]
MRNRTAVRAVCLTLVAVSLSSCSVSRSRSQEGGPTSDEPSANGEASSDSAGDPYYPKDGNGGYDVTAYHVQISYDPASHELTGDTLVTSKAAEDLSTFNLDLQGLDVQSVTVGSADAKFTRSGDHELVITPPTPVASGATFETRVKYSGVPEAAEEGTLGENGWQLSSSGGAFAAGEPHSATSWYPANDTPKDKATFKLDARVPDGWSVISNGVDSAPTEGGDGWTTYHWNEPSRIATYLTTVGIDKWTFDRSTLSDGTPVVSAYAPGTEDKQSIEARLPEILDFLASKFGPYPQSAAGGIYVNENIGFSLETQTRPIYASWAEESVVVHENAHQWYGDSVSVDGWKDICLNECFASYASWLWDEAKNGANLDDEYRKEVARGTDRLWSGKLYDMGPGNEFTAVYEKGPLALHALRRLIGDEAFDRVLKEWPAKHKDSNASWPEFEQFTQQIAGKDLSGFFKAWFHDDTQPADEYLYPGPLRK